MGRAADGRLGFVSHSYTVQAGKVVCQAEEYFESVRKIAFTFGGPLGSLGALRFPQDPTIWTDPAESVVRSVLAEMRDSTATSGGPDQIVCLDGGGSRWISSPPALETEPAEALADGNITALISMVSPTISGGTITAASLSSASISGGSMTIQAGNANITINSSGIVITGNGFTTTLNNGLHGTRYAGVSVRDNGTGEETIIAPNEHICYWATGYMRMRLSNWGIQCYDNLGGPQLDYQIGGQLWVKGQVSATAFVQHS